MLRWWRVNGSTAREPFPCTHPPINEECEAVQAARSAANQPTSFGVDYSTNTAT